MKKMTKMLLVMVTLFAVVGCGKTETNVEETTTPTVTPTEEAVETVDLSDDSLAIYCGAGMQKPFEVIAKAFEEETGCTMNVTYANAAQIQTQIKESQEGDFFIAGSKEEVKPVEEFVGDSKDLVKHIPVLIVSSDNEKGITGLNDLTNEGVTVVIGDPESTPVGKIAMKAFKELGIVEKVNIAATTTTAPQLANVVAMKEADAAIVWKENANVEGVMISETTDLDNFVKVIPAACLSFNENEAKDVFKDFLASDTVKDIWTKFGYEIVE